jgi:hypothetical protein
MTVPRSERTGLLLVAFFNLHCPECANAVALLCPAAMVCEITDGIAVVEPLAHSMNQDMIRHRAVVDYASSFLLSPAACVAECSYGWA